MRRNALVPFVGARGEERTPRAHLTRRRVAAASAGVAIVVMVAAGVAWAGTILGTPRSDVLKGTPRGDKIYGKAGNDRLFGYGGTDLLVGGPGADLLACGSGRDVAIADKKDRVRRDCEVVKGLPKSSPSPPSPSTEGLYIALGDSISEGGGASTSSKGWVRLYFGHLVSSGSGVTRLHNLAQQGQTTDSLRTFTLPRAVRIIDDANDTLRVTINIGGGDVFRGGCPTPSDPQCPVRDNLRAILTTLNEALARDPGDETIQIMEYYNKDIGTSQEGATRRSLLGGDLKVDCSGTGGAIGLNDLIHCIALEKNAVPVDVLRAFDAGGESFLADDHVHPSDAGHRAIALAFGGAVERSP
jgi:lysophospholipase L1-like esterase